MPGLTPYVKAAGVTGNAILAVSKLLSGDLDKAVALSLFGPSFNSVVGDFAGYAAAYPDAGDIAKKGAAGVNMAVDIGYHIPAAFMDYFDEGKKAINGIKTVKEAASLVKESLFVADHNAKYVAMAGLGLSFLSGAVEMTVAVSKTIAFVIYKTAKKATTMTVGTLRALAQALHLIHAHGGDRGNAEYTAQEIANAKHMLK